MTVYRGEKRRGVFPEKKEKIDVKSFLIWIGSILLAMIPVYVAVLKQLGDEGKITRWFIFDCLGKYDALWAIGTVLLLCCFNVFAKKIGGRSLARHSLGLAMGGFILFLFMEFTWFAYKYGNFSNASPNLILGLVVLGIVLALAALIISTPLQLDFIKGGMEE